MTKSSFDPRLALSVVGGKLTGTAIRLVGRGGGTAAPGLVADKVDTGLLTKLSAQLPQGAVLVAGTNGKTTTTRMIADIFQANSWQVVHNRSGSNLVRGVVAAYLGQSTPGGHIRGDIGVIEADEAAMPELVRRIQPRVIVLNNLFRDQLDRYGELDTIAKSWQKVVAQLSPEVTLIVNADDQTLVALTDNTPATRICIGLNEAHHRLESLPHAADAAVCRVCGADLEYRALYLSHLGEWYCTGCGRERPSLAFAAGDIALHGDRNSEMTVTASDGAHRLTVGVPGLYNAYNALASAAVARAFGVSWDVITPTLTRFQSAFGRIERIQYQNRSITLALVKNPTGFNEVLRMLTAETGALQHPTIICINDLDADGRDVSWLWDVDFELLAEGTGDLFTTGIRGADMANRLKYAGVPLTRIHPLSDDLAAAFDAFIQQVPEGASAYILPSYTAMLRLRKTLADRGIVQEFWEQ
ncbi:MAG: MurT ligase domain-containing protein [Thermomicrobiales bacterium]|nr:MurT ligase domain-containing protein [Thermomicrobiales bacterium]